MSNSIKTLFRDSLKSADTEETIDIYFTRPIGLVFALLWNKLGVHPNAITILSIFLGIGAGYMFYFSDLTHNLMGVVLLMLANFCDSTDGQMARLTGKKTLVGRVLDGFSGDVWFFCIYFALCLRLQSSLIPYTNVKWGFWIWALAAVSGLLCHSPQSSLADYYRQIHLLFLKGKKGSELDTYANNVAFTKLCPYMASGLNVCFTIIMPTIAKVKRSEHQGFSRSLIKYMPPMAMQRVFPKLCAMSFCKAVDH